MVEICEHSNSRMSTENLCDYTLKNYLHALVFPGMEGGDEGDGKQYTDKPDKGYSLILSYITSSCSILGLPLVRLVNPLTYMTLISYID